MLSRRRLLLAPGAWRLVGALLPGLAAMRPAAALPARAALGDPLRLAVDRALVESGLAPALLSAFASDTGIPVKPVPGAAVPLLQALERGELDVALTNAPDAEARLEQQGLAHDRQAIAAGEFAIVGPALRRNQEDALGAALGHDAAAALQRLAQGAPGAFSFVSAGDGSGTHLAEQALWRAAGVAPATPWYVTLAPGADLVAEARARGAFAVVERGAWRARGGPPLAIRVEGDPRQVEVVHVLRAFRVNHPAGRIFVDWIASAKGRRVVAAHGYHAAA